MDKELGRDDKENKEERDKFSPKDLKNRNKREEKVREKSSRDREVKLPVTKGYRERVDDRTKDREIKQRRYDEKKLYGRRDERENVTTREERRLELKDDRRYETKEELLQRDSRERRVEEKRGKSYEKMRQEKKKLAETKKLIADANEEDAGSPKKVTREIAQDSIQEKEGETSSKPPIYNGDESKHVGDNECAQHDTAEDRVTAYATQDCRDNTEEGNDSANIGRACCGICY